MAMGKRVMLAVVGAGIGSLAGLLASFLGAGNPALIAGAVIGAVVPLLWLGPPRPVSFTGRTARAADVKGDVQCRSAQPVGLR